MQIHAKLVSCILVLWSSAAVADYVRAHPANPLSNESIRIDFGGMVAPGLCGVEVAATTVAGSEILIDLQTPDSFSGTCPDAFPFEGSVVLGPLAPGVYTTRVLFDGTDVFDPETLPVRDASDRIRVVPDAAGSDARATVLLIHPTGTFLAGDRVLFGGVEATDVQLAGYGTLRVTAPEHGAGVVDVEIVGESGLRRTVEAAFTFFDSAELPPPSAFTPVLFPVMFEGPGAFGSVWTTEAMIHNAGFYEAAPFHEIVRCPSGDEACSNAIPAGGFLRIEPETAEAPPGGVLAYVPRSQEDQLHFALRVRDVSRQAESFGTHVPVITENELLTIRSELVDVPTDERFRHMLRVYDVDGIDGSQVRVLVIGPDGSELDSFDLTLRTSFRCVTNPCNHPEAAYAQVVLEEAVPLLGSTSGPLAFALEPLTPGLRYWGFITITNNETQQVTIVTPE